METPNDFNAANCLGSKAVPEDDIGDSDDSEGDGAGLSSAGGAGGEKCLDLVGSGDGDGEGPGVGDKSRGGAGGVLCFGAGGEVACGDLGEGAGGEVACRVLGEGAAGKLCLGAARGEVVCGAFGEGAAGELCLGGAGGEVVCGTFGEGAAGGEVVCGAFGEGAAGELCLGAAGGTASEAFGDVAAAMAFGFEALDPCEKDIEGNGVLARPMEYMFEAGELNEVGMKKN